MKDRNLKMAFVAVTLYSLILSSYNFYHLLNKKSDDQQYKEVISEAVKRALKESNCEDNEEKGSL